MSFTFGFYDAIKHDRRYNALQMGSIFDGIIKDGVYATLGGHFIVEAVNRDNMVSVQSGRAWFNHTWNYNDSNLLLSINPPDVLYDRYDAVVIDVNSAVNSRTNSVMVVYGEADEVAVKPTMIHTEDHNQYPLCYIYRKANVMRIVADDIENMVGSSQCPFVTGVLETVDTDQLITQWKAQWNTFFNKIQKDGQDLLSKYESEIDTLMEDIMAVWATFLSQTEVEFRTWFDNLEYILDGDVATKLAKEVLDLQTGTTAQNKKIEDLETKAGEVEKRLGDLSFAQDEEGNWGYKVGGADTVTPFKHGSPDLIDIVAGTADGAYMGIFVKFMDQNTGGHGGPTYQTSTQSIDVSVSSGASEPAKSALYNLTNSKPIDLTDYQYIYYYYTGGATSTTEPAIAADNAYLYLISGDSGIALNNKSLASAGFIGNGQLHIYDIREIEGNYDIGLVAVANYPVASGYGTKNCSYQIRRINIV